MRKLLIGAMMASLFMVSSDADAFSLFGKKSKTTSDASSSKSKSSTNLKKSASAPNLGTKKVGLFSKLTGKASKQKTENATIYSQQMGSYFEAPVAAICIQSGGLATFFSDELKNEFYVKNTDRNKPDMNAKTNIQSAIKAFKSIYNYMRKILQNEGLLTKTDAEKTIEQLKTALIALVGTGEEQNKPSKFWKYFGNHIRYSLIVMRNSFSMLLYPDELWNVGAALFCSNEGAQGRGESTIYHMGSLNYPAESDEARVNNLPVDKNSPVYVLREGLAELINDLLVAESLTENTRQSNKQARKKKVQDAESRVEDVMPVFSSRRAKADYTRNRLDVDTQEYGGNEPIDEDAYANAWMDEEEEEDVTDPRPSGRYYR